MTQRIDCDEALPEAVLANLAESRSISPSAQLDRTVRALLAGGDSAGAPFPRPLVAAGLGTAACLALVAALSVGLAGAGAAENAPLLAVLAVSAWLAVSAAATLPLVLFQRRMNAARSLG